MHGVENETRKDNLVLHSLLRLIMAGVLHRSVNKERPSLERAKQRPVLVRSPAEPVSVPIVY